MAIHVGDFRTIASHIWRERKGGREGERGRGREGGRGRERGRKGRRKGREKAILKNEEMLKAVSAFEYAHVVYKTSINVCPHG